MFYLLRDKEAGRDELENGSEIISLISRNAQAPVRHEKTMQRSNKVFCHDAATMMPPLRPRIGKQKVNDIDGVRRKQIFDGVGSFHAQDAHIAQTRAGRFAARA